MLGIKNDKDLGERLVDVCGVLFCLGVLCLVARGLLPLFGDDTPAGLKYQESAREKGLTPLFGDYAAPGLERRESVLARPLRLAYTVGLIGGAAGILLGFCLWRPRRHKGRGLEVEIADLQGLSQVLALVGSLREASRIPQEHFELWEEQYAEIRNLRTLNDSALFELGVDVLSGLIASVLKGTQFEPSTEDTRRLHESLTYLLEETKLRGIGLQEVVNKRDRQIRQSVLRLSGVKAKNPS